MQKFGKKETPRPLQSRHKEVKVAASFVSGDEINKRDQESGHIVSLFKFLAHGLMQRVPVELQKLVFQQLGGRNSYLLKRLHQSKEPVSEHWAVRFDYSVGILLSDNRKSLSAIVNKWLIYRNEEKAHANYLVLSVLTSFSFALHRNLHSNKFSGAIPADLGHLQYLEEL